MSNPRRIPVVKVLGVVVNYRVPNLAIEAVASLLADFDGLEGSVTVVENDSQDGSLGIIQQAVRERGWADRVTVIASDRNGGFGAGNNLAFRAALASPEPPEFFFLLNPDATVHRGTTLTLASFLSEHVAAGAVGARVLDPTGNAAVSAFRFPSMLGELESSLRLGVATRLLSRHVIPLGSEAGPSGVDWVSGSCVMIRREALLEAGIFDERFFLYFEEVDLCRRIRSAGFTVHHLPQTGVDHHEAAATGVRGRARRPRYWHDSRRRYFEKHHGRAYFLATTLTHVLAGGVHRLRCFVERREPEYPPHLLSDMMKHALRPASSSEPHP
jgi:N-acetylglucosaminyl-diphospho-decaprenol L-rhamnosyltransferase